MDTAPENHMATGEHDRQQRTILASVASAHAAAMADTSLATRRTRAERAATAMRGLWGYDSPEAIAARAVLAQIEAEEG